MVVKEEEEEEEGKGKKTAPQAPQGRWTRRLLGVLDMSTGAEQRRNWWPSVPLGSQYSCYTSRCSGAGTQPRLSVRLSGCGVVTSTRYMCAT